MSGADEAAGSTPSASVSRTWNSEAGEGADMDGSGGSVVVADVAPGAPLTARAFARAT